MSLVPFPVTFWSGGAGVRRWGDTLVVSEVVDVSSTHTILIVEDVVLLEVLANTTEERLLEVAWGDSLAATEVLLLDKVILVVEDTVLAEDWDNAAEDRLQEKAWGDALAVTEVVDVNIPSHPWADPSNLTATDDSYCDTMVPYYQITLDWTNGDSACETNIYRDDELIATVDPGVATYLDDTVSLGSYAYEVIHVWEGVEGGSPASAGGETANPC